jgi:hypothetical protein
MKIELTIIAITAFFIYNAYHDGKYTKILISWKRYYQMAFYGFLGLSLYLFIKKYPTQTKGMVHHANDLIKYMPIDKSSADLLTPVLSFASENTFFNKPATSNITPQHSRMLSSGGSVYGGNVPGGNVPGVHIPGVNINGGATKRSVSETKKKYIAAEQGWRCGKCSEQLTAWFEVDHKIRLDRGGTNEVSNLVALCRNCHGEKTALENL